MTRHNLILLFSGSFILLTGSLLGLHEISQTSLELKDRSLFQLSLGMVLVMGVGGFIAGCNRLYLELTSEIEIRELTIDWFQQTVDSGFAIVNVGLAVTIFPYTVIVTKLETSEIPGFTFVDDRKKDWYEGDKIKVKLYLTDGQIQEYVLL